MSTVADILKKEADAEWAAAEAMRLKLSLTVREYLELPPLYRNQSLGPVYIYARGKMSRVGHIRWPETDPWVVCPDENAGFGLSYCVHYGTILWAR
jgi:hypothetical protein